MIRFLSSKLADFLCEKQVISDEDKEICEYGYELIISFIIGVGLVLLLGIIFGRAVETAVFIIVFMVTRQYCGGYHANSYVKCISAFFTVYCIVNFLTLLISSVYEIPVWALIIISSEAVIFELSPIENINKPMSEQEKKSNRIKSIIISLAVSLISLVLFSIFKEISLLIALTLLSTAVLMIIEKNKKEVN